MGGVVVSGCPLASMSSPCAWIQPLHLRGVRQCPVADLGMHRRHLRSPLRIGLKAFFADRLTLRQQGRHEEDVVCPVLFAVFRRPLQRLHLTTARCLDDLSLRELSKWHPPCDREESEAAKRESVGMWTGLPSGVLYYFWSHPMQAPTKRHRQPLRHQPRQAEVYQLCARALRPVFDEDVGRFQVAVDYERILRMQVAKRAADVQQDLVSAGGVRVLRRSAQEAIQRRPPHPFEHKHEFPGAWIDASSKEQHDMRVPQVPEDAQLVHHWREV
eukprot:CAMPEP_0178423194 /NCGR_PEP_ID=MMETSP0689_2-20121128/27563_1 /TAXON_ID=160604 /ORGANISM="Amphidinium massartii, Strain CS-259" /LENGTH=271 /DNA_ID=CAMNT_0020044781 /DNA_START=226 /DNA_END=1038 /DNA_ORIENTATION=-